MKLLLDQNLSPRLVQLLHNDFPESIHVSEIGFAESNDRQIWQFAREQGYLIVTRDSDFMEMSTLLGSPPKVIWIRLGNCPTNEILSILRLNRDAIQEISTNVDARILILR